MEFKILPLNNLIPADYNPRKNLKPGDPEFERIKNSILAFGFVDPIIVNSDMTIIGGHQRAEVLKSLGRTEAECVVVNLDKTKEKALNVALNKITGEWDKELLAELVSELQAADFDITLTGFDPEEFKPKEKEATKEDDFDLENALTKTAISKSGDIWQLGRHRLVCGDSTDSAVFEMLLEGKKVNLVLTDPPYNVDYEGKTKDRLKIQNDKMKVKDFYSFLLSAFGNILDVMANDASIYVFHGDTEGLAVRQAFHDAGFDLSCVCIWAKQSLVLGRSPYHWMHEPVLFGWKKGGRHKWFADNQQSTYWRFDRPSRSAIHPTMKPIALCAYPIINSSTVNSIVFDPFGGSGSTLIAAEQTGRNCYIVEIDPKYTDAIVRRYIEQVGNDENVFVLRDGIKIRFSDVPKDDGGKG